MVAQMMYIKFIPSYPMVNLLDEPMKDEKGNKVDNVQFEFLLGRLSDPAFSEGLEGYDAVAFVIEVRDCLKKQKATVEEKGYWELENEPAKKLKTAAMNPKNKYNPMFSHNLMPFLNAIKNMADDPNKLLLVA